VLLTVMEIMAGAHTIQQHINDHSFIKPGYRRAFKSFSQKLMRHFLLFIQIFIIGFSYGPHWKTVSNLSANTYNLTGLLLGMSYHFKVESICVSASTGDYSAPYTLPQYHIKKTNNYNIYKSTMTRFRFDRRVESLCRNF